MFHALPGRSALQPTYPRLMTPGWLVDRASSKNKKPYRFPVKGRLAEILAEQRHLM